MSTATADCARLAEARMRPRAASRDTMHASVRGSTSLQAHGVTAAPADAHDWEALMAGAQAGDQAAYTRLLAQLLPWLRGFYARRLPPAVVDDAAQEALIAVHEKRHTYQPGKPLRPWVAAIARYKWIDRLRAFRAHVPLEDAMLPHADDTRTRDGALVLDVLLRQLKPAQADAIRLVKLQGYSVAEASRITGQSVPLVKINIHRGIARLVKLAEAEDGSAD